MLILTRKPGESLYIGDRVKVTIVEIKGSQVRVGIGAPAELKIYREEIYSQILEENQAAAHTGSADPTEFFKVVASLNKDGAKTDKDKKQSVHTPPKLSSSPVTLAGKKVSPKEAS